MRFFYFAFALSLAVPVVGQLTPTPAGLTFTWQVGAALPAAQVLAVKGTTSGAYVTSISPFGTQWITVTPSSGVLPASLSILINPNGLAVGMYSAVIVITGVGANAIAVPVKLTVGAPSPTLLVSASALSFSTPVSSQIPQTLTLTTTGGPIPFTAAATAATWMTVSPTSGVVLPGVPVTVNVYANSAGLDPSATALSGKVTIGAIGVPTANKTQTVAVTLLVNALVPTITNLWPSAVLVGSTGLSVTVTGTGFYKGTTILSSASSTALKSTYISPTTIVVALPASALLTSGALSVAAVNPAPGGVSMAAIFTVSATPVIQAIVSAASYAAGAVSPGELVTLFGTAIGPTMPSGMSIINGYATLILQSTSVVIDGKNAAMIYVSANQMTVQVPYDASIGLSRAVVVNNNGMFSATGIDVVPTAPGLFALDASGIGECAALTVSAATGLTTVNGTTSPAAHGDIVVFYLTGEGIYDLAPSPATGYIVPTTLNPLPQISPLPTVFIGGAAATVLYAGPMGGGMLGVMQLNVLIPAAATVGSLTPVMVTIGGVSTQQGATIVLK